LANPLPEEANVLSIQAENWPDAIRSLVPKLGAGLLDGIFKPRQFKNRKQNSEENRFYEYSAAQ
jgi:hypothetical protein